MATTEQMDETVHGDTKTTGNFFLNLREEYLTNRTSANGLKILEEMLKVNGEEVDEDAWLDGKDVLTLIIEDVPAEELLLKHQMLLLNAIQLGFPKVVTTLATLIARKPNSISLLKKESSAVAVAFARQLNIEDGSEAIAALCARLGENSLVVQEINHQLVNQTTYKFRLWEVLLQSFLANTYTADAWKPLVDDLVEALDKTSRDVLERMSIIELLSDCAIASPQGAQVLNEAAVPMKIYQILKTSKDAPDGGFYYSGFISTMKTMKTRYSACIRFFGSFGRRYPGAVSQFPEFLDSVVDSLRHFDLLDASQRLLMFDTFSNIAHSVESKAALEAMLGDDKLKLVLQAYGAAINSGPVDLRVRHMHAAALIFEESNDDVTQKWLSFFGEPFPTLLLETVKKPFVDMKMAALALIRTLFDYPPIIGSFFRIAGFTEWLLDENSESEYGAAAAKRSLVTRIIEAGEKDKQLVDAPLMVKLKAYLIPSKPQPQVELAL